MRVLCFGDSNTWGYQPRSGERFPKPARWTQILQTQLGSQYEIIEEGLNGRTFNSDYQGRLGKNGLQYLRPCLDSHYPVDVLILWLGTNDTKVEFSLSPERICDGLRCCLAAARGEGIERPTLGMKIIVVAPPLICEKDIAGDEAFVGAEEKTRQLPKLFEKLTGEYAAHFVDLSRQIQPSSLDGCHVDIENQGKVAEIMARAIR